MPSEDGGRLGVSGVPCGVRRRGRWELAARESQVRRGDGAAESRGGGSWDYRAGRIPPSGIPWFVVAGGSWS